MHSRHMLVCPFCGNSFDYGSIKRGQQIWYPDGTKDEVHVCGRIMCNVEAALRNKERGDIVQARIMRVGDKINWE